MSEGANCLPTLLSRHSSIPKQLALLSCLLYLVHVLYLLESFSAERDQLICVQSLLRIHQVDIDGSSLSLIRVVF